MRRLLVALLFVPTLAMAQQAPKMASDDVMALLEKGEVFYKGKSGKAKIHPKAKPQG